MEDPSIRRAGVGAVGVAALPGAPQVIQYDRIGWLPTEVARRRDLDSAPV